MMARYTEDFSSGLAMIQEANLCMMSNTTNFSREKYSD